MLKNVSKVTVDIFLINLSDIQGDEVLEANAHIASWFYQVAVKGKVEDVSKEKPWARETA